MRAPAISATADLRWCWKRLYRAKGSTQLTRGTTPVMTLVSSRLFHPAIYTPQKTAQRCLDLGTECRVGITVSDRERRYPNRRLVMVPSNRKFGPTAACVGVAAKGRAACKANCLAGLGRVHLSRVLHTVAASLLVVAGLTGIAIGALVVGAQPGSATISTPPGTAFTINATAGQDNYDPHVDGNLAVYSTINDNLWTIHYHDLTTNQDYTVPNDGTTQDFLSDVNAGRIAFTRVSATSSDIALYDTTAPSPSVTLVDNPNNMPEFRDAAQIGGNVIAWQDYGVYGSSVNGLQYPYSDILAYNLTTGVATDLNNLDGLLNQTPAISPDGSVITWAACDSNGGCSIQDAVSSAGSWMVHQLTPTLGSYCSHPDTNGVVVAYSCNRIVNGNATDRIYFQPVDGGTEQTIPFSGSAVTPAIAGNFISFAGEIAPCCTNHNLYVAELTGGANPTWDGNLYQITNDTNDNQLNDITVTATGLVTVVWQVQETAVLGFTFQGPTSAPTAVVTDYGNASMSPISLATNTVGPSTTGVGGQPGSIAITPDDKTAYVVNSSGVAPIDVATGTAGTTITSGMFYPEGVAITPDGTTAYVSNSSGVAPIDVATGTAGTTITSGMFYPEGVAITPDGTTAYVSNEDGVTPIDLGTNTAGTPITVPGLAGQGIAITPDGKTAYVVSPANDSVTPFDLTSGTPEAPITGGGLDTPYAIAITPDGTTAYVTNYNGHSVTPIDLTTNTAGSAIPVGNNPYGIAITPDGKTVYVANFGYSGVTPIDTATNIAQPAIGIGPIGAWDVAITPDGT